MEYSVWVHTPDFNEKGMKECVAKTKHMRQAVAVCEHERGNFPDRTVEVWKRMGPDDWYRVV